MWRVTISAAVWRIIHSGEKEHLGSKKAHGRCSSEKRYRMGVFRMLQSDVCLTKMCESCILIDRNREIMYTVKVL